MKNPVFKRNKKTSHRKPQKKTTFNFAVFTTWLCSKQLLERPSPIFLHLIAFCLSSVFKFSYLLSFYTTLKFFPKWSLQPKAGCRWHIQGRIFCVDIFCELLLQLICFPRCNLQRVIGKQIKFLCIPFFTSYVAIKTLEGCTETFYLSRYMNL